MLSYSELPGYQRTVVVSRPKLDGYTTIIDQILDTDLKRPNKQRNTAARIFERLRDESDFTGGRTIVSKGITYGYESNYPDALIETLEGATLSKDVSAILNGIL